MWFPIPARDSRKVDRVVRLVVSSEKGNLSRQRASRKDLNTSFGRLGPGVDVGAVCYGCVLERAGWQPQADSSGKGASDGAREE